MADIQQYQKYRMQRREPGSRIGKIVVVIAILVVLYLIGRAIFGGGGTQPEANNDNVIVSNANVTGNLNINGNVNVNNANDNTNTNLNTNTVSADKFSLDKCTQTYSRGKDKKQIALTFNVGTAKEGETQKVLDALNNGHVTASFFVRGDIAETNPDLINKIDKAGFPIYNLSYNYPHFNDLPESGVVEQLKKADDAISQRTEKSTKPFFRPPFGELDRDAFAVVKQQGYCPVTWTVDALDWSKDMTADDSLNRVLSKSSNGSIILMQAANSVTAEIVPKVITELGDRGYTFVSLPDLLSD